jgi:Na+-driven multidrug efflux pump
MLRLRANTLWPAMHECTLPFFLTEGNREAAADYSIFIGTSQTRQMLQTMLVATATFFAVYYLAPQGWGNNALWAAFLSYLFVRSIVAYWQSTSIAVKKS